MIGTIPVGIAGLVFNKQAESTWRNPFVMGCMLIAVGVLMWVAENAGRRAARSLGRQSGGCRRPSASRRRWPWCPARRAAASPLPPGLFRDLTRESAARFSFLLSTPAIGAAAAKALYDMHKHGGTARAAGLPNFLVGVAVSTITGCAVIAWFLHYLRRAGLRPFVYYRIVFGIIVIALAFIRRPA